VTKPPPDKWNYVSKPIYVRKNKLGYDEFWINLRPARSKRRKPEGIAQVRDFRLGQILFTDDSGRDQEIVFPYTKPWKHDVGYEVYADVVDALRRSDDLANGEKSRRKGMKPIRTGGPQ